MQTPWGDRSAGPAEAATALYGDGGPGRLPRCWAPSGVSNAPHLSGVQNQAPCALSAEPEPDVTNLTSSVDANHRVSR